MMEVVMDPVSMGLIGGGASLLGNVFSSMTNAANTQAQIAAQGYDQIQAQGFNAQQAQMNRDYQTQQAGVAREFDAYMSNTAYQRASQDMQKAGLNPMMMFGSGGPSSTPTAPSPSGAAASSGTPSVPMPTRTSPLANLGDVVTKGVSSAAGIQELAKQTEATDLTHWNAQEAQANARKAAADATIREREVAGKVGAADREAREEGFKAAISKDEQRAAIQSPYIGQAYGNVGSQVATPAKTVIDAASKTVSDMMNQVTGPTGAALWQGARDAASRTFGRGKFIGPEGTVLDLKDFPNIRKTTLNNDYQ